MTRGIYLNMPGWRQMLNRGVSLYLVLGFILYLCIDPHEAYLNRVNVLKDIEYDLEMFLKDRVTLNRDQWLWGVRYYKELQKYAPDNSLYVANEGFCYYYLKQYDKAAAAYKKAISLEPFLYTHHWDSGMIYLARHEIPKAIDSFLQALSLIPITVQYYIKTVEKLSEINKDDFSALFFSMNQRAQEDEGTALLKIIDVYFRTQNYEKVIEVGAKGLNVQPQNPKLNYILGLACLHLAQYGRAVYFLTRAIDLNFPEISDAYHFRSIAQKALGNTRESQVDSLRSMSSPRESDGDRGFIKDENAKLHLNIELRILRSHFSVDENSGH